MSGPGWDKSAEAWIARMSEGGDWTRVHVLDPAVLARIEAGSFRRVLDVGCGEGRFCRMLAERGIETTGIDPTSRLIDKARILHPEGAYRLGMAEELPFADDSFDLVVSYLSLIDIEDYASAIAEMARVLAPGGHLLAANLNGFATVPTMDEHSDRWERDQDGRKLHFRFDHYFREFGNRERWDGIDIVNYHRPLSAYMREFLAAGLQLVHFDEPRPVSGRAADIEKYCRVPYGILMEWRAP